MSKLLYCGNSKAILTVSAKYDDHPSAYIKHPGSQIYALDRSLWVWNTDFRFTFDMMSAHNILEWEQITNSIRPA